MNETRKEATRRKNEKYTEYEKIRFNSKKKERDILATQLGNPCIPKRVPGPEELDEKEERKREFMAREEPQFYTTLSIKELRQLAALNPHVRDNYQEYIKARTRAKKRRNAFKRFEKFKEEKKNLDHELNFLREMTQAICKKEK